MATGFLWMCSEAVIKLMFKHVYIHNNYISLYMSYMTKSSFQLLKSFKAATSVSE